MMVAEEIAAEQRGNCHITLIQEYSQTQGKHEGEKEEKEENCSINQTTPKQDEKTMSRYPHGEQLL